MWENGREVGRRILHHKKVNLLHHRFKSLSNRNTLQRFDFFVHMNFSDLLSNFLLMLWQLEPGGIEWK